jgi:hypothetical protein
MTTKPQVDPAYSSAELERLKKNLEREFRWQRLRARVLFCAWCAFVVLVVLVVAVTR